VKVPREELYQCRGCSFVHRFPSKVRRHFHYRHSVVPPYRCGHCSYRAVERGKVVKHCRSAHPTKTLSVLNQDDGVTQAHSNSRGDDDTFQRTDEGRTNDLSFLRNISPPSVANRSSKGGGNSTKSGSRTAGGRSSEYLDDNSMDESDDSDDDESSDEYEPPSSKKKKSDARTRDEGDDENWNENDNDNRNENDEERAEHIPCETIFAINRETYRPHRRSQTPSDREESSTRQPSASVPETVHIKTEPKDDYEYQSAASSASVQTPTVSPVPERRCDPVRVPVGAATGARQFFCVYCGLSSKWNRRDVRLHVMHVHVGVRAFSCGHCGFGNSRNRAVVRSHCAKSHPGRELLLIDNEHVFEAIDSVQDHGNLVSIAFTKSDGTPLLTIEELDEYLATKGIKFRTPSTTRKTSEPRISVPETLRKNIRNSVQNQSQPSNSMDDSCNDSQAEPLGDSFNSSGFSVDKDQMEQLNCRWKCRQCDFSDLGFEQVENHIVKEHLRLELYSCFHCQKYFSESQAVLSHVKNDHAGLEQRVVSTVDEKSKYIRRNIECASVQEKPASGETECQTSRANSDQSVSANADAHSVMANSEKPESVKPAAGVPSESGDEHHESCRSSVLAEPVQTDEVSPIVESEMTQEKEPSFVSDSIHNILQSTQEHYVATTSIHNADNQDEELRSEVCSRDEVTKVVDDVPEFELSSDKNLRDKRLDVRNKFAGSDVTTTNDVDDVVSDAAPSSTEKLSSLTDLPLGSEHAGSTSNLSLPATTSDITLNEGHADDLRTTCAELVRADGVLVSADKKGFPEGPSSSDECTKEVSDVAVPPVTSNVAVNEENSGIVMASREEPSAPEISTDEFRQCSQTDKHIQKSVTAHVLSSTLNTNTCEEKNNVEEIISKAVPVSSELESGTSMPDQHAIQLSHSQSSVINNDRECVDDERNSNGEEKHPPLLNTDSDAAGFESGDRLPCNSHTGPRDDSAVGQASPPYGVEKNLEPATTDAILSPSNASNREEPSGSSAEDRGHKPSADAASNEPHARDAQLSSNPLNVEEPRGPHQEPHAAGTCLIY